MSSNEENEPLRSSALQNAHTILQARKKAERELLEAKEALEDKAHELDRSLAMMRATLESTTDGILVTDATGRVTDFNSRFRAIWQFPADGLVGANHLDLVRKVAIHFVDPQGFIDAVQRIYREAPGESYDLLELRDGRVIERFSRPQLIGNQDVGRVWSLRDVTEQKRVEKALQESETRLNATFSQAAVGIAIADLSGRFVQVNEKFANLHGYAMDEILELSFRDLTHPEDLEATNLQVNRLLSGETNDYHTDKRYLRKDGNYFWSFTTVTLLRNEQGRPTQFVGVIEDITARKKAEQERSDLLSSERTARIEAENLGRLKDEFLATLSHELRTPLTAIVGWCHLIRSSNGAPDQIAQGLEVIERSARVQTQLVADLLDMSRIISGKMRLDIQLIELPRLIEAALESVRPAAEAKGVIIETIIDPVRQNIYADPDRMQQILWNLLSNAVKFTPRGGKVSIHKHRVGNSVEVVITDTGKGISPDFLPHVFERFRQADATASRHHGGLGIGLALVKQLVELHGGKVRAESEGVNMGSTFIVQVPLFELPIHRQRSTEQTSQSRASAPTNLAPPDLTGINVVVVDDERDTRELLVYLLESSHANVTACSSAEIALDCLASQSFDVIVSDIAMPGKDGLELLRELRTDKKTIPAIAVTAFAREQDRDRAMEAGYDAYLAKPVDPAELLHTVSILASSAKQV